MSVDHACDLDPLLKKENKRGTCKESNAARIKSLIDNSNIDDILFTGPTPYNIDKKSLKKISEIGLKNKIHVVYFSPIPRWERLPENIDSMCRSGTGEQWYRLKNPLDCTHKSYYSRQKYDNKTYKSFQTLKEIEDGNPYFHVYNIHELLCNSTSCPSHINSTRIYRDNGGHLSIHAVREFISDDLENFLIEKNLLPHNNQIRLTF